jgi:hypothetical protein
MRHNETLARHRKADVSRRISWRARASTTRSPSLGPQARHLRRRAHRRHAFPGDESVLAARFPHVPIQGIFVARGVFANPFEAGRET